MNDFAHHDDAKASPEDHVRFARLLGAAKLVIFDFDGVIADSEVISLSTLQNALGEFGLDLSLEETRASFLGTSLKTIMAHVNKHGTRPAEHFPDVWETALFARFAEALQPVPQVYDLIQHLEQNQTKHCIASSSTFRRLNAALAAMGAADRFAYVFSAEQVARGKPAPDLFEFAAAQMGVDPQDCLVIEDSPHGIHAARAAHMPAVGFTGGRHLTAVQAEHRAALRDAGAVLVLPSFTGFQTLDPPGKLARS